MTIISCRPPGWCRSWCWPNRPGCSEHQVGGTKGDEAPSHDSKRTTISRDELLMRALDALPARPEHHPATYRAVAYSHRFGHSPSRTPQDQDRPQGVQVITGTKGTCPSKTSRTELNMLGPSRPLIRQRPRHRQLAFRCYRIAR